MHYCFELRFRTSRPIHAHADRLDEEIRSTKFKQLRFWRPWGTAKDENWLAIESCGYAISEEARDCAVQAGDALLIGALKREIGIELTGRGAVPSMAVYPGGQSDVVDPGAPLPVPLEAQELIEMVSTAVESALSLTTNQRVAAELLNDSFFEMSPEARFLLRVSAIEAMCPQDDQTGTLKDHVDRLLASIPAEASSQDRNQLEEVLKRVAKRQTVRGAYMSKIRRLLGDDDARRFDDLYRERSNFLHDGAGRGTLGQAANAALELCWKLLQTDINKPAGQRV
jgi:hypothetical protein